MLLDYYYMQIRWEVLELENSKERKISEGKIKKVWQEHKGLIKFIIELAFMIVVGFLTLLPLMLFLINYLL